MNTITVNWNSSTLLRKYEDLLSSKVHASAATIVVFLLGALLLALWVGMDAKVTPFVLTATIAVHVTVLILLSLDISLISRQLRSIETYLGFYDRRHDVRHQIYCEHHGHCLVLHPFKRMRRDVRQAISK